MERTVLIISNHHNRSRHFEKLLSTHGIEVERVATTTAARVLLRGGFKAECVILDMVDESAEGKAFVQYLRSEAPYEPSRIMIIGDESISAEHDNAPGGLDTEGLLKHFGIR